MSANDRIEQTFDGKELIVKDGCVLELRAGAALNLHPDAAAGGLDGTDFIVRGGAISRVVKITQAAYDALSPPNPTTLYLIVG